MNKEKIQEHKKIILSLFYLTAIFFFLDYFTKLIVGLSGVRTTGHIVDITYVTNTGSLFSLFANIATVNTVFIVLSFCAIAFILYYVFSVVPVKQFFALSLLLGGILGNLVDRIVYGAVVDWINFHFWPVFNLADAFIVVGVIFMIKAVLHDEVQL